MTEDLAIKLLEDEYFKLQDILERFDDRTLQIKGWSVTVSLAGAVAALISDKLAGEQRGMALLAAATGAVAFWLIETYWKSFQWAFFDRIGVIEAAFRDGTAATTPPLQISRFWGAAYHRARMATFWRGALMPSLFLPHAGIAALSLAGGLYFVLR